MADAEKTGWRDFFTGKNAFLTAALFTLIFTRSIDQTLFYRLNFAYEAYVWYLSTVILPIAFLVISWPVVWYKMWRTDDITPEMRNFPLYKFAIMGLFDTLFNLFSTFPIYHLGSDLSNILSQSVLPINMLGSMIFLRARYRKSHYIGAALVIYGCMIRLIPEFDNFSAQFVWIMMMVVSQTPAAASNIYKEIGLKGAELDIWYANAWIGMFQLAFGILTVWTVNMKEFMAPHKPVPWSDFWGYVGNANDCFWGHTVTDVVSGNEHTYCSDDPPYKTFLFFIVANITYNQCMLYVFKTGSSVLFVIASACRLPLVDLFCMSRALAGRAQQQFTVYDGFALFILVLAIYIYYSEPELQADPSVGDTPPSTGDISLRASKDRGDGGPERTPMLVSPHVGRHMYSGPQPHDGSVYQLLDGEGRSRSAVGRRVRSASVNV